MLSAAALLDELMGVDRDRAPDEKKTALHWSDPQVVIMLYVSCQHGLNDISFVSSHYMLTPS